MISLCKVSRIQFSVLWVLLEYMQRVELIQDLKFETATTRIKSTPDGEYLIASGKFSFYFVFLVKIVL